MFFIKSTPPQSARPVTEEEEEEDDDEKIGKIACEKKLLYRKREDTYKPIRHCLRYRWVCGS